ncbi:molybdopterin oxidoreductase family protein [Calothrix sp. UHCC 0171]|uniref:molybdopterin oxidoreductase family protein n=1 Tax=Calothrix sp. UHCC 0171 TaxID=3110245 RepID=UPI003A5226CF
MINTVKTLCPYCGVGCGLEVASSSTDNPQSKPKVRGDRTHPSSQGMVCVKGATVAESLDQDRLLYPMVRDSLDEEFRRVSWDEVLNLICDRIHMIRTTFGADGLCMYGSGQMQTEDYYVAQKLLKGCLGTNNFDSNSRLCMSSAVKGYSQSLGSDGPPCCYEDLELTDCAFIIGSNTAECHPIVFNRFAKYHKKNPQVKLIVVDPRRTPTAEIADLHLAIRPGTDINLLNGIAHLLLRWGKIDAAFIEDCTNDFHEFAQLLQYYPPEAVAETCGISLPELETAARYWAESKNILSLWSMGVNQSREGTAKVNSIINLHLLTGQIGKPGAGPFSLTGQPNAMGGRETGGLANLLPGYRLITNPQHRTEVEQFWGVSSGSISPHNGRTAWDMITGLEIGDVQMLWVVATNPAVSLPDLERTKAALRKSPFTICQDAYYPTETAAFAHVLLPAAQWGEKTGTMTNSERVVTLCQAFRQPPGEAKPDWEIFAEVARRLGFADKFAFPHAAAVHREFVQLTKNSVCDMSDINHDRLKQEGAIQWGTSKRLYTNHIFPTPNQRANFVPRHALGLAEPPDPNFPFILTTGRVYGHWHTQTRTGRIEKIRQMYPEPFIEIHPLDANDLGIIHGNWVEVRSRRGNAKFCAKVTRSIAPGTVFVPIHWGAIWAENAEANALTHPQSCPDSLQPELKACAVQLIPIAIELTVKTVNSYQLQPSEC